MTPLVIHPRERTTQPVPSTPEALPAAAAARVEEDLRWAYVRQGMLGTFKAFSVPTLAGCALPSLKAPLVYLSAAEYARARCAQPRIGFRPEPTPMQAFQGGTLGLLPFLFWIPAHTKMQGMPRLAGLSQSIGAAWGAAGARLPTVAGAAMKRFPIQFLLGRWFAQMGAASTGAIAQGGYLSWVTASKLERLEPQEEAPESLYGKWKEAGATAFATFSIPAALSTAAVVKFLQTAGASPVQMSALNVTFVVGACIATTGGALRLVSLLFADKDLPVAEQLVAANP